MEKTQVFSTHVPFPKTACPGWSLRHTSLKHRGGNRLQRKPCGRQGSSTQSRPQVLSRFSSSHVGQLPHLRVQRGGLVLPSSLLPPNPFPTALLCSALQDWLGEGRGEERSYPSYRPSLCLPVRGSAFDRRSGDNAYLPICFPPLPSPLKPCNLVRQLHALLIVGS